MRQPQVRYTQPLNKAHSIGLSVERSGENQVNVRLGSETSKRLRVLAKRGRDGWRANDHVLEGGLRRTAGRMGSAWLDLSPPSEDAPPVQPFGDIRSAARAATRIQFTRIAIGRTFPLYHVT